MRLPEGTTPLRYDVALHVDPSADRFTGKVTVSVSVASATRTVVLHARALTVDDARIDGHPVRALPRMAFGAKEDAEELVLASPEDLAPGQHTIDIVYSAPFNRKLRGLYKVEQGGHAWAFTQLEAVDARRMFPCFDEPRFKTPFTLHVAVPPGMNAVSGAPEAHRKDGVIDFEPTLPLPTYLVALAVGELEITEGPKAPVPIRLVTTPGKSAQGRLALEGAAAYLGILGAYFDRPYPYPKLDLVAVPDFGPGAMENAGLVTFREELLLIDEARATLGQRRRMESVLAHELAHQWFGNLVTMGWWDDLWLNEGFATWMGSKACDQRTPGFGARLDVALGKLGAMNADALPSAWPVRVPVTTSDAIVQTGGWTAYTKGSSVLSMVESYVGEDAMRTALRGYVKDHAFGTVTSDDLLVALSKSTGKDVATVARSFLDQPGVPIVDVAVTCDAHGASARLTQSPLHVLPATSAARTWAIPVCMRVEGVRDPVCARLDGPTADVPLPRCPAWILPNESERGYYRFGLDRKWLLALAKAAPRSLGEAERAALPSHAWAMFQAGRIGAGDVFEVLAAMDLGHEPSRLVLEESIAVLTSARDAVIEEGSRAKFAAFVSRLLRPALARLGEERKVGEPDDARLARQAVTAALFDLASDVGVAATAEKRAAAWLADPSSVDPDLGALALRVSSRAGGVAKPEVLFGRLEHDATPSDRVVVLVALASSADPKVIERTLGLVAVGKIRVGDFRYVWGGTARMPDSRKLVLDWMLGNFDELASHISGAGGLAGAVGWTCTRADQERAAAFFRGKLAELEGATRAYEEGLQQSELCIVSRSKGAGDAATWLVR